MASSEAEGKNHTGALENKAKRNFTDAKSRFMPAPGGRDFVKAYSCQAVVDSAHQAVVAAHASNQTSDKRQAVALVEEVISNVGAAQQVCLS